MNNGLLLTIFVMFVIVILLIKTHRKKKAKTELNRKIEHEHQRAEWKKKKQFEYDKAPTNRTALFEVPQWTISPPSPQEEPIKWTLNFLMSLEWKRFEEVCVTFLSLKNYNAKVTCMGADGGIDIKIKNSQGNITTIGQCKAWKQKIGVNLVRELYGIMASESIENGIYLTTSSYTNEAIEFCKNKKIRLINGQELIQLIRNLNEEQQNKLLKIATNGDYTTPTCVRCNTKMIKRTNRKDNSSFWGCANYPRCRNVLQVRKTT